MKNLIFRNHVSQPMHTTAHWRKYADQPVTRYRTDEQLHRDADYIENAVYQGRATKDIAEDLGLSMQTVRDWIRKIGCHRYKNKPVKPELKLLDPEEVKRRLLARPGKTP